MLSEGATLILGLASALFVILCLAGAALGAFAELRPAARHHAQPAATSPAPPEPDEYDLLVVLDRLDDDVAREMLCQKGLSMHHV